MRRKNRNYKKGGRHRDARLFVIVAEGKREDAYFRYFNEINQRILVQIVPRVENKSAPKLFLERIEQFIQEDGWTPKENDVLWFVLDVDRWERKSIEDLRIACQQNKNWHLGISNPCFEVWLLFHLVESFMDNEESCGDLKSLLHEKSRGGFEINRFAKLIAKATKNAAKADTSPNQQYPDRMQTKLYLLAQQMLEILGASF